MHSLWAFPFTCPGLAPRSSSPAPPSPSLSPSPHHPHTLSSSQPNPSHVLLPSGPPAPGLWSLDFHSTSLRAFQVLISCPLPDVLHLPPQSSPTCSPLPSALAGQPMWLHQWADGLLASGFWLGLANRGSEIQAGRREAGVFTPWLPPCGVTMGWGQPSTKNHSSYWGFQ